MANGPFSHIDKTIQQAEAQAVAKDTRRAIAQQEADRRAGIRANRQSRTIQGGINVAKNLGATYKLKIEYVPSTAFVEFPAFITGFSDAYNVNWNAEEVFGRSDPIATYQNTRRAISVSFQVVAYDINEARENLLKINYLMSMLYPLYEQQPEGKEGCGNASTINMGPLLRVKFGNLIQDAATGGPLLGYVNGFTVDPELEEGFFLASGEANSVMGTGETEYVPKSVRLNFEMTVLHEHSLGWIKGEKSTGVGKDGKYYFRGGKKGFPYQNQVGKVALPVVIGEAGKATAPTDSLNDVNNVVIQAQAASILGND